MCGRYALYTDPETLLVIFELADLPRDLVPRFNIAPSQDVPAVRAGADGGRELRMLRWGLVPSWSKGPEGGYKMINARAETAAQRPAFRAAVARRRCLLPADGFYEWRTDGKARTPHFIRLAEGRPMALAGLWEHWKRDGASIDSRYDIARLSRGKIKGPIPLRVTRRMKRIEARRSPRAVHHSHYGCGSIHT